MIEEKLLSYTKNLLQIENIGHQTLERFRRDAPRQYEEICYRIAQFAIDMALLETEKKT